jgi:hypothetical protein
MTTALYSAPPGRSRLVMLLGIIIAIAGALGTLLLASMLGALIPQFLQGHIPFLSFQLLFQLLWLIVMVSLFVTGISLINSGVRHKRKDLVPGLTLYFLGAALAINGLLLFTFGNVATGVALFVVGALAMIIEWSTEVI